MAKMNFDFTLIFPDKPDVISGPGRSLYFKYAGYKYDNGEYFEAGLYYNFIAKREDIIKEVNCAEKMEKTEHCILASDVIWIMCNPSFVDLDTGKEFYYNMPHNATFKAIFKKWEEYPDRALNMFIWHSNNRFNVNSSIVNFFMERNQLRYDNFLIKYHADNCEDDECCYMPVVNSALLLDEEDGHIITFKNQEQAIEYFEEYYEKYFMEICKTETFGVEYICASMTVIDADTITEKDTGLAVEILAEAQNYKSKLSSERDVIDLVDTNYYLKSVKLIQTQANITYNNIEKSCRKYRREDFLTVRFWNKWRSFPMVRGYKSFKLRA